MNRAPGHGMKVAMQHLPASVECYPGRRREEADGVHVPHVGLQVRGPYVVRLACIVHAVHGC